MISGSVAVEGGARALPPPFPAAEFLRPLPRAPPYARQAPAPAPEEAPSAAPAYPPVPGAYRFLPHFYGGYGAAYHQLQGQHHQQQQHHQQHLQQHQQHHQHHQPQHQAQHLPQPVALPPPPSPPSRPAPRGKEGSLKHRLLSRERPAPAAGRFSRGALIQLDGGQLRRVEDMRTEDFVLSAERSAELRLADSTVVRLLRRPATDTVTLTLSYNRNRAQVDMESPVEHPFFVYGQGWASCSPERTLQCYGLQVNRLQVGDVCVSLMPRETPLPPPPAPLPHPHTVVTTATTTAMTVRPAEAPQRYPENLSLREDRKRRSSAPDICPEDNNKCPRTLLRH